MKEQYKIALLLLGLFILALGLRINMIGYNDFFEFDNYWEARMTRDVLTTGSVHNPDNLAYFSVGYAPQTYTNPLWIINAIIYHGTIGWWAGFNNEYFTKLMQLLPAIFGALTCLMLYFVGKAASHGNKAIGLLAMFVATVTPAFIYRGMLGAQQTNAFGFLPFSIGILFLILAFEYNKITKKSLLYSIIAGACFAFMVFSWSMYLIVPLVLLAFWAYRVIACFFSQNVMESVYADVLHFIIILSMFLGACGMSGINWMMTLESLTHVPIILIHVGVFVIVFCGSVFMLGRSNFSGDLKGILKLLISLGFVVLILGTMYFTSLDIDLRDNSSVGSMIGEEAIGHNFFTQKYNIFNIIIPLTLICAMVLFLWKGNKYQFMPMILAGFMIFFIMAWLKLKFTYTLGFGLTFGAIIIGMLAYELWVHMKEKHVVELKIIFIPAIMVLIMGIAAAGVFIQDYVPQVSSDTALEDVINYINNSTLPESKIMNSWGLGHILTYTTNRKVLTDNRNYSTLANQQFSIVENDSNSSKVYELVRSIGADYILVQLSDLYRLQSNEFYIANKVDSSIGIGFRDPLINIIDCSFGIGSILICPTGNIDINAISGWTTIPYDFYQNQYPIYVYVVGSHVLVLNTAANNTNLVKMLVNASEMRGYYEKVFISGDYVLFKVIK